MEHKQALHIVGLSGGKDSTALALRLAEIEPRPYRYICNETGNELPEMIDHWKRLEEMLGAPIIPVRYKTDLTGLIDEMAMLPSFHSRFCTRVLKIEPTIEYFEQVTAALEWDDPKPILHVGLRADEELRTGIYGEDLSIKFDFRDWGWGINEVRGYLAHRGVKIPKRTDCALCPYQRLIEWRDLWENHPDKYAEGVDIEKRHGHTFRSPGRDQWPASLEDLAKEFAAGRKMRMFKRDKDPDAEVCRVCQF